MTTVTVPSYHYALVKGYLLAQTPPSDVLASLEALHMAAVQGPLRNDALEAIRLVSEAAEKLIAMAGAAQTEQQSITVTAEPEAKIADESTAFELPAITKMALERASSRENQATTPQAGESDEDKISSFLRNKGATPCPPAHASGDNREAIVAEPKKRKEWSPEARAAAGERMRKMQDRKREERQSAGGHAIGSEQTARQDDQGNVDAPEKSGAHGIIIDPKTGYEIDPKTGAIKLF